MPDIKGKTYYADLVILSDDPYEIEPDDIKDIKVLMTMMNGEVTFKREGLIEPNVGEKRSK